MTNKEQFEKELIELQNKYWVNLYAANCVLPNGEVMPLIKIHQDKVDEQKDEDTNKK